MHLLALASLAVLQAASALVANLPAGIVVDNFASNLGIATDFDWLDDNRIVVSGKRGVLMLIKNGTVQPEPLFDISSKVNYLEDRGMSTVAVHPQFPTVPYIYVGYVYEDGKSIDLPKQNRISRLKVEGDKVVEETVLFGLCRQMTSAYFGDDCFPIYGNSHAIDQLQFKDGRLYASFGEGELFEGDYWRTRFIKYAPEDWLGTMDPRNAAGKILRLDPLTGEGVSGNPFWTGKASDMASKVWAVGGRNPWRSTPIPGTNSFVVANVGWYLTEWAHVVSAGANMGWPCYEGGIQAPPWSFNMISKGCQDFVNKGNPRRYPRYTNSSVVIQYSHQDRSKSIIGGAFAPTSFPGDLSGAYIYADFVTNEFSYLPWKSGSLKPSRSTPKPFMTNGDQPVTIKVGRDGKSIWYLGLCENCYQQGVLRRIRPSSYKPPVNPTAAPPSGTCAPWITTSSTTAATAPATQSGTVVETTAAVSPSVRLQRRQATSSKATSSAKVTSSAKATVSTKSTSRTTSKSTSRTTSKTTSRTTSTKRVNPSLAPLPLGWETIMEATAFPGVRLSGVAKVGFAATGNSVMKMGGGANFASGWGTQSGAEVRMPLNRNCFRFTAEVGLDDTSATASRGNISLTNTGTARLLASQTMLKRGDPPRMLDFSGLQDVTSMGIVSARDRADTTRGALNLGIANPRIYCGPAAPYVPNVAINSPSMRAVYKVGDTVRFQGNATTWDGKPIPPSRYNWLINLIHCQGTACHVHYHYELSGRSEGAFEVSDHLALGAGGQFFYFRLRLGVADECGYYNYAIRNVNTAAGGLATQNWVQLTEAQLYEQGSIAQRRVAKRIPASAASHPDVQ